MKYEDIMEKTITLLSDMTEAQEISVESELMDDLGIGSMDLLSLLCNLEVEFNIHLPERIIRKIFTVGDLVDIINSMI